MTHLKHVLKSNGFKLKKDKESWHIMPIQGSNRWLGLFFLVLGIFQILGEHFAFGSISIAIGLVYLLMPTNKEMRARNINAYVSVTRLGFEIKGNKFHESYKHEEVGDIKIEKSVFQDMNVVKMTTNHIASGKEVLIMRALDSKEKDTETLFQKVGNKMIQHWEP